MRYIEGGEVSVVFTAIETCYIAVYGHSGIGCGVGCCICPAVVDSKCSVETTTFYLYRCIWGGCYEIEFYRRVFGYSQCDVAVHIYSLGRPLLRRFGTIKSVSSRRSTAENLCLASSMTATGSSLTNRNALEIPPRTNDLFVRRPCLPLDDVHGSSPLSKFKKGPIVWFERSLKQ